MCPLVLQHLKANHYLDDDNNYQEYDEGSEQYFMYLDCGTTYYLLQCDEPFIVSDAKVTMHYNSAGDDPMTAHAWSTYEAGAILRLCVNPEQTYKSFCVSFKVGSKRLVEAVYAILVDHFFILHVVRGVTICRAGVVYIPSFGCVGSCSSIYLEPILVRNVN